MTIGFLVADHSKFQRTAPARIASLKEIDALFTSRALFSALAAQCEGWQTKVVVAGTPADTDGAE